ncbi:conjugation system SOS inhibitor PsiB [Rahnella contaminans]|uniref:conjugation system SOS inhibitor PsiB n=1 Tax=Rahnella contaminans TaxID=2703882 RepID=UPI003C2E7C02
MKRNGKLTFAKVHAMTGSELEQYAERGEADRSDLSRAVIHHLHLSDSWGCDSEYACEFGGGAPVNVRLTLKCQPAVTLCLSSPSDDVPYWRMCLPFDGGTSVAWLYCAETFDPRTIYYTLQRIETLTTSGITTPEKLAVALRQAGGAV